MISLLSGVGAFLTDQFFNIDNMNTEGNKAKHLKIERETSA